MASLCRRSSIVARYTIRYDIFWALERFEADYGSGSHFDFAMLDAAMSEGIDLIMRHIGLGGDNACLHGNAQPGIRHRFVKLLRITRIFETLPDLRQESVLEAIPWGTTS